MKILFRLFVPGLLLSLVFSFKANAEDVNLEEIVITPSRIEENCEDTGRNISIITRKDIENSQAKDISEVLGTIASVDISDYGGIGANKNIRMRGSTAAQVLILIDGRPINNPRDGQVDLSNIPVSNIERIELLHGPASNLYGAQAMGGTVNIITKNPPKERQETEIYSGGGSFHTFIDRLSHGAKIGSFGYLITGDYESSEGFRDNTELSAKDFNTKFEYDLNKMNKFIVNTGFLKKKVGNPGKIGAPDFDDKQVSLNNFVSLDWKFKPEERTLITAKIYNNYDRLEFVENTAASIFETSAVHTTKVKGLDLQLSREFWQGYNLVMGFNYVSNLNDSTFSAKHKYLVRAGYFENCWDLFQKLKLTFGARIDNYSNFGTQASPSFTAAYKLNEKVNLRGLVSRSFRAPTFNDLYWPDDGMAAGNPNLKPEKGITAETGVDLKLNKHISSELTYFWTKYNELINWGEIAGIWMPVNIGSAIIKGIEFKNKFYICDFLEFDLDYAFLDARDEKTSKFLVYQPVNKVDARLVYKDLKGFRLELKGQFTGERFNDPENFVKVKEFFVFGLNLSKKFKHGLTYHLSIDNLFDRNFQVIQGYPMPGITVESGVKFEF